jgi:hypothetical protein
MTHMEHIRKALQNHGRGVITDAELAGSVFPALSEANLKDFLVLVSPAVLQVLTREAPAAPRTEEGWRALRLENAKAPPRDADAGRSSEVDVRTKYRRGVEALRRHVEGG